MTRHERLATSLAGHPAQRQPLSFQFDGRRYRGYEGDTIASALYAAGVRLFSRSFKYHRPRGLLCVAGGCPNCLMNVDGIPNVRTCTEPLREGTRVRSQNAWPSLGHDALSILDRLSFLVPVGFYYKTFIRPRRFWPLYEGLLRRAAGLGRIDARPETAGHDTPYQQLFQHTDIAVVGGGPAGLSAARAAAASGLDVTLIDDQPKLGGHLRYQARSYLNLEGFAGRPGHEIAARLTEQVRPFPDVQLLTNATAFGLYEGDLLGILQGRRLIELRAQRLIIATGRHEYLPLFPNNDLPGVMLAGGVQRLMHLHGVRPGRRALVVSGNDTGLYTALDLLRAGVELAGVADLRPELPEELEPVRALRQAGVPLWAGHTIREATGRSRVKGAVVVRLDEGGGPVARSEVAVRCDLIALSLGFEPLTALLHQGGCRLEYDPALNEVLPTALGDGLFAAGDVAGTHELSAILLEGELAGLRAALSLRQDAEGAARAAHCERSLQGLRIVPQRVRTSAPLGVAGGKGKSIVCLCEDVTEKDIPRAMAEGFDSIETLKRYSTVSMGPCQGRMCSRTASALCARESGAPINEVGRTVSRPPYHPVPLGALGGRLYQPVRVTSMHHRHLAAQAEMMDTGEWRRPRDYRDAQAEVRAVRELVGLIDLATLGKLEVVGKDAVRLLERVYLNRFSDLRVNRIRYGAICDDAGVILDDGTVCRLAEESFFVTTTTTGVQLVEEWLTWWAAGTGMCVHVTNVTSALAAVNLAGPRSRDVLQKLTDLDLQSEGFPYLAARRAAIAGVPALLLRIGFVGELGYEMHFPAEYGEYLWDTIMEAGQEFGIVPFGVEAQRVLRLEKGHIIVTQDTDGLSTPLEADMAWLVKFEKPDFIGRPSLERVQAEGLRQRLVGFVMQDPSQLPEEGAAVVHEGFPVGRVTSAKYSSALGRPVGMAWVPEDQGEAGTSIEIRVDGRLVAASVVKMPFYDPEGSRMRA